MSNQQKNNVPSSANQTVEQCFTGYCDGCGKEINSVKFSDKLNCPNCDIVVKT